MALYQRTPGGKVNKIKFGELLKYGVLVSISVVCLFLTLPNIESDLYSSDEDADVSAFKAPVLAVNESAPKPTQPIGFSDIENLKPTDPVLLDYIRKKYLHQPSTKSYNLKSDEDPSQFKDILSGILKNKERGIFLEAGANDGEFLSNTLALEKRGWTGVLIEGNPNMVPSLLAKVEFLNNNGRSPSEKGRGRLLPGKKADFPLNLEQSFGNFSSVGFVECFPLTSILASVNISVVDLFSLDVGGYEFKILSTIIFDQVTIKVIQVKHNLAPEGSKAIKGLLEANDYLTVRETDSDYTFVKRSCIEGNGENGEISII